jgi:hypothetical protein
MSSQGAVDVPGAIDPSESLINETIHSYSRAVPYVWMDAVRLWRGSQESV